jgi:uncharacterized protein (TIGR02118 family)
MTVRMSIFRKKPDLAQAEFQAYWKDVHAPIALQIPALQRYEQNCAIDAFHSGEAAFRQSIDGVCKLLFENETAMLGVMSPDMTRMLLEDEAKFLEGLRTFVVRQATPVAVSKGAVTKCVSLVTRRRDWDTDTFEQRWSGPFAAWVSNFPGVRGYAQNFVTARTADRQPASYEQSPVDCIDELWLEAGLDAQAAKDAIERMQMEAGAYASALNSFLVTVNVPAMR